MAVTRIAQFDTWRPGYGLATVHVYRAGSTILADVFSDEACTIPAGNPQVLQEKTVDAVSYGKFAQPLYVAQAYELKINSVDVTGIDRPPLTSLEGENATLAWVLPTDADKPGIVADHLARRIDVRDYGDFIEVGGQTASAAANTVALVGAIGAATSRGGGIVEVPGGIYDIMPFSVPGGVTLRGRGRGATILQCTQGGNIVTLVGDRARLECLTLDGLTKNVTATGVYSLGRNQVCLRDVEVKRFEVGGYFRGGELVSLEDFFPEDNSIGLRLHGDNDTVNGGNGTTMFATKWSGGLARFNSIAAVELKNVDLPVLETVIERVGFDTNIETAIRGEGLRSLRVSDCWWVGNADNIDLADGTPENIINTVQDVVIEGGRMAGGRIKLKGALEAVSFRRMDFEEVEVVITTPKNQIQVQDCRETDVTLTGATFAWLRSRTDRRGASAGFTTDAAATKAWAITLEPGQRAYLEAKVIGRARNSVNHGYYHIATAAFRSAAPLAYDTQTGQFTPGNIVTGQTSGASGRIVGDTDNGTTGTLLLQDVIGAFLDNEIIKDSASGAATVNGPLGIPACAVSTITSLRAADANIPAWAATFVANGPEIELRVTGSAGQTVEWIVDVDVVST